MMRGYGTHPLPALSPALSRLDDPERLLLADTSDLRQRDGKLAGLVLAALLECRREHLGIVLLLSVEQVRRQRLLVLVCLGRSCLDLALVVLLEQLAQGDLLAVALLVHELGFASVHRLRNGRLLVR